MMRNLVLLLLVAGIATAGRIARESEKGTNQLDDFISEAKKNAEAAAAKLNELFGLDKIKTDDMLGVVKKEAENLVDKLKDARVNLDKELKAITNKTVADFYKEVDDKVQETIDNLKKAVEDSGVSEKAADLQKKLQEGVNVLIDEGKKIADATGAEANEAQKKLREQTQKVIEDGVKALNEIKDKVTAAAKE